MFVGWIDVMRAGIEFGRRGGCFENKTCLFAEYRYYV